MKIARAAALAAVLCGLGFAAGAPAAVSPVTWCGTAPSAADLAPEAATGFEVHVIYAFPSDGTDRFGSLASAIATDLASVDAWWTGQDPTRRLRFDLYPFPGCAPGFGQLDISRAQLPGPASRYASTDRRLVRIAADLAAPPFAFASPDKKYLVYYDGPTDEPKFCGEANAGLVEGGREAYAAVYLAACGQNPGDGESAAAITAAHELTHALNAVVDGAPHLCEQGHVCDGATDLMKATGSPADTLSGSVLDIGRDDYYGHSGSWWDVQDSPFLVRLDGPDRGPPAGPAQLTPTSDRGVVSLRWPRASDDAGPLAYRIYRDGALLASTPRTSLNDAASPGRVVVYGVRAADGAGNLGPLVNVRFEVGRGVVDEEGRLVRDTVPPSRVRGLRATQAKGKLVLRWRAVRDRDGLRGYLVERNGRRYRLVRSTSIPIPDARARARWSVRAIDRAGNVGPRFQSVRVR